jgi:transmembrane sensor
MSSEEFEELMVRKFSEELSEEDSARFNLALQENANKQKYDEWKEVWHNGAVMGLNDVILLEEGKRNISDRIKESEPGFSWNDGIVIEKRKDRISWRWAAAVFLVLVSSVAVWKTIGKTKPAIVYQTASSELGELKRLSLSDGTQVLLNANTKFKFPTTFDSDVREVYLEGEAWFDVVSNPQRPFLVHTGSLTTRVTGTHFNVKAFTDESQVEVSLVSGKVSVEYDYRLPNGSISQHKIALKPMERLSHRSDGDDVTIAPFQEEEVLGWKTGLLVFKNASLNEIVGPLSRRFGVKLVIKDQPLGNCRFTTQIINQSLEEVLTSLTFSLGIKIETSTNQLNEINYFLTGQGCAAIPN